MAKKLCHTCTTISQNVFHDGKCPRKKKAAPKKKHEKAARRVSGLDTRLGEARVKLREAEDLLTAEEDRHTRRAAREQSTRRQRLGRR